MTGEEFRPGQRVTVAREDGVWTVVMYADDRAAGFGQSVGLIRESDGRELELADDEFAQISASVPTPYDADPEDTHPRWHETFDETFVQTYPAPDAADDTTEDER